MNADLGSPETRAFAATRLRSIADDLEQIAAVAPNKVRAATHRLDAEHLRMAAFELDGQRVAALESEREAGETRATPDHAAPGMDLDGAQEIARRLDRYFNDPGTGPAERAAVVLGRALLEAGETRTEWGVRFHGTGQMSTEDFHGVKLTLEGVLRRVADAHPTAGAKAVQRQVGPWTPVDPEAESEDV